MLPILVITVFLSAALMFTLQPLVARLLLPVMGGSPAVWNTCMVFFQAVLLAGYAYAHAVGGLKRARIAAAVHLGVLALALAAMPVALPSWALDPPRGAGIGQAMWVLMVLAVVAGLPMFAVSATAPLAQRLLAGSRHAVREKPYFLYAASNAGSLLALLAYPVLIEPGIGLRQQGWVWMAGYAVFVASAIGSVLLATRLGFGAGSPRAVSERHGKEAIEQRVPAAAESAAAGTWRERSWWLVLSAAPSSLLLGVTSYLSTDVAAIPLLWVAPLAVYLATFIIAFSERTRAGIGLRVTTLMLPLVALSIALTMKMGYTLGVAIPQQLLLLLVASLACHVELARRAPATESLTEFYLIISIGGVIGGVFNSLVAPAVFDSVLEYPIAVAAACLAAMGAAMTPRPMSRWRELLIGVALAASIVVAALTIRISIESQFVLPARGLRLVVFLPGLLAGFFVCRQRPAWFALALSVLLAVAWNEPLRGDEGGGRTLFAARTFFGVHRVNEAPSGRFHTLTHGTTVHGLQFMTDELRGMPTMYYHPTGPIGHVFRVLESRQRPRAVAVVGLGAGALAAYGRAGSGVAAMDFYEIDPEVVRIARDPGLFTYIRDAEASGSEFARPAQLRFIIGDGRLELAREQDSRYDLIVLDAFSSDAIPVHLLTREAMAVYRSRLAPGGLIAVHISNRHIDLVPVLDAIALAEAMSIRFATDGDLPDDLRMQGKVGSQWAALARDAADLRPLEETPGMSWVVPDRPLRATAWTDDWSNVVGQLRLLK